MLQEFEYPPDVIIADLRLRDGESGTQAIALLQGAYEEPIPGLIVTGDIAAEMLRGVRASRLPIMHKPCDVNALYEFLQRVKKLSTIMS